MMKTPYKDRAVASILGGAIGDALGVTQEVFPKSESPDSVHLQVLQQRSSRSSPQTEYEGGGPWVNRGLSLRPGEWTDDTAMMLCLSDSILNKGKIDIADLMARFADWRFNGYNSCQEFAFGLGRNVKSAISKFDPDNPNMLCGGTDPTKHASNGSLMRLAPVPVYWSPDLDTALAMSRMQTATTHNVPECLDGSALMAFAVWCGINGASKEEMIINLGECPNLHDSSIVELASPNARWLRCPDDDIQTLPGRCSWSLEAAFWCIHTSSCFEESVVKAINLGGDADTVGSITGQIAGALYGETTIPKIWIDGLMHAEQIRARAESLFCHYPYDELTMRIP